MAEPPFSAAPKPCCVCAAPNGKHPCPGACKSRNYCSRACQVVDWKRGHKKECKDLAAAFQDRLLDELMPKKKVKEEPPIVAGVAPVFNTEAEAPGGSVIDESPGLVLGSRLAWTFAIFLRICAAWAALLWRVFPEKLDPKNEEPAIVEDVAPAEGSKAAARLSAVPTEKTAFKATGQGGDAPNWRGICAICLDLLPIEGDQQSFSSCCCKWLCTECATKYVAYAVAQRAQHHDERCPFCRTPTPTIAEYLSQLQKHADKGDAEAQYFLGDSYKDGTIGLKENFKRAAQLYERAATQGHARAQNKLGYCYEFGTGVKIDLKAAVQWYRHAAEQGYPLAQRNLGIMLCHGRGVAQSYDEAVRWWRLAAAQGDAGALFSLGVCHLNGQGVPLDNHEALRLFQRAAAKGYADAAAQVEKLLAAAAKGHADAAAEFDKLEKWLAATFGRPA